jgi:transcriptional regulator with XRE-family HTH domain
MIVLYGNREMRGNFIYQRLGGQIFTRRKKKGLSQEDLSILSDVDRTYIGKVEQGKANPSFKTLLKISRALRVRVSELLKDV